MTNRIRDIEKAIKDRAVEGDMDAAQFHVYKHPVKMAGEEGTKYFLAKTLAEARKVHKDAAKITNDEAHTLAVRGLRGNL